MKLVDHNYRPEIDGLRAVSILCVLFYHLGGAIVPGGYIGVDVFFVISGYLITRNIVDDISVGKFSLRHFYTRRIRRLFPALLFTIAATFLAAALWFPPDALRGEARTVIATLPSISNIQFWRESSQYFTVNAKDISLLHTWSLSVEEQFYLVWSVALSSFAALRWQKLIPLVIFAAGMASLVASQYWLSFDQAAAFYLMPFRIFELSIGALCIWAERWKSPSQVLADLLFVAGIVAILASATTFTAATPFPGVHALLPSLGAACIIFSGMHARIAVLLNNRLAVGIGLISYSLYLCHWPIFVFYRYIFGEPELASSRALLFALSFLIATFMYYSIEKPFRFGLAPISAKNFLFLLARCAAVTAPILMLAASAASVVHGGWPWRLNEQARNLVRLQSFGYTPCSPLPGKCVFGDTKGRLRVEFIGDSHAQHLVAAFQPLLLANEFVGQIYAEGACIMLVGIQSRLHGKYRTGCRNARAAALADFSKDTMPLVISQDWVGYRHSLMDEAGDALDTSTTAKQLKVYWTALEKTFEQYGGSERKILVVGPQVSHNCEIDQFRLQPGPLSHAATPSCPPYPAAKVRDETADFAAMLLDFQRAHTNNMSVLLPVDYLCRTYCPIQKDGLWLYQDGTHLTVAGAEFLGQQAGRVLKEFIAADRSITAN